MEYLTRVYITNKSQVLYFDFGYITSHDMTTRKALGKTLFYFFESLTTNKPGPNQGRKFHKCAQNTCKFFEWDDESGGSGGAKSSNFKGELSKTSLT